MSIKQRLHLIGRALQLKRIDYREMFQDWGIPAHNLPLRPMTFAEAMGVTTVWCGCRVLGNGLAQVPWRVVRKSKSGKEVLTDHPLSDLLRCAPNQFQTSFEFREMISFHITLAGEAHVFLDRVGSDRKIISMLPITPELAKSEFKNGKLLHSIKDESGRWVEVDPEFIWRIRGPAWGTHTALPIINIAAKAIGLAIDTEEAHALLFENGAQTSGTVSVDGSLSSENHKKLKDYVEAQFNGKNRFKPMVLDRGAKWLTTQMSGVDAQHIETRKFQVEEVARALVMFPIMLMQADKASTFASAEQMFTAHHIHTLMPHYTRVGQSADKSLLTRDERDEGVTTEFVSNDLMRGTSKDRSQYFARALGAGGAPGWMSQNDVRRTEGLDDDDGDNANTIFFPNANALPDGEDVDEDNKEDEDDN